MVDTDGFWRRPAHVIELMAGQIGDNDGCNECGYAFTYIDEGCDACRPITVLLAAAGRGTRKDH